MIDELDYAACLRGEVEGDDPPYEDFAEARPRPGPQKECSVRWPLSRA